MEWREMFNGTQLTKFEHRSFFYQHLSQVLNANRTNQISHKYWLWFFSLELSLIIEWNSTMTRTFLLINQKQKRETIETQSDERRKSFSFSELYLNIIFLRFVTKENYQNINLHCERFSASFLVAKKPFLSRKTMSYFDDYCEFQFDKNSLWKQERRRKKFINSFVFYSEIKFDKMKHELSRRERKNILPREKEEEEEDWRKRC